MHACTDTGDVCVVVLTGELRLLVPHQSAPNALDLVRGNLLTVPGPADHCAERTLIDDYTLGNLHDEGRVAVVRIVLERSTADTFSRNDKQRLLRLPHNYFDARWNCCDGCCPHSRTQPHVDDMLQPFRETARGFP